MDREVREAIAAGERALNSLKYAKEDLDSARSWGIADLLGGGSIIGLMKHSKMNHAVSHKEEAKSNLRVFQRELQDVTVNTDLNLEVGDFLTFADFFFDGVVADYLVQSKISDARKQVDRAIRQVSQIVSSLRRMG